MSFHINLASFVGIFVLFYYIEASPVDLNNGTLTVGPAKASFVVSSSSSLSASSVSPSNTTPVPPSTVTPVAITSSTDSQKNGTSTGGIVKTVIAIVSAPKKTASDEECDEEPVPEPEGNAKNATSTDRQGKELKLGDEKDRYTHENSTAEPEPEVASNGKLTGNSTTASPATGSSSIVVASYETCLAIAIIALSTHL